MTNHNGLNRRGSAQRDANRSFTNRSITMSCLYVAFMLALAGVASWPIYGDWWFIVVAAASVIVGGGIALLAPVVKAPGWAYALILVACANVLAVGVGIPSHWGAGTVVPDGLRESALGFITGWKDLATSPLPVGNYRNLLVPAIAIFVAGAFFAFRFAFSEGRRAAYTVVALGAMLFFGLIFGRTSVSSSLHVGPMTFAAPIESAIGIAGLIASVWWLRWRAKDERRRAIARATAATGMRGAKDSAGAHARRMALAGSMVVVAVAASVVVSPIMGESRTRDVIRSAVGPEVMITAAKTPLSDYRTNFTNENLENVLFTYTTAGAVPPRIRLATLGAYDGESYRVEIDSNNLYQRVPSRLDAGPGNSTTVRIEIGEMNGIWLPTFGSLERIQFQGAKAPEMADGFYYNAKSGTGVVASGVEAGESYLLTATEAAPRALEEAQSPGANPRVQAPESLIDWLDALDVPSNGVGLSEAISTLRERGYLSHALLLPSDGSPADWMGLLDGYVGFQSSTAGHSLGRIDDLFSQLLEHESQVAGLENPSLVAAVGDDEQFAVASALIAQQLGFPARVVVGVRTESDSLPTCDGSCTASDLAVWTEVQDASGSWIAIDVTPQFTDSVNAELRTQRDPENITDVRPREAKEVAPPDPDKQASDTDNPEKPKTIDTGAVTSVLRYSAIGVLGLIVLLAPFITVLIAKRARRRERKLVADTAERITLGWEEYVDAAVDAGLEVPTMQTRQELAEQYKTTSGHALAVRADHAQFSNVLISDRESDQFWEVVAAERREIKKRNGWWRRLRAALSLKSFVRQLAVKPQRKSRSQGLARGLLRSQDLGKRTSNRKSGTP